MRCSARMFLIAMILAAVTLTKPWPGLAVPPQPQAKESKTTTVAILLFDGVEIIDYSGPWEVFGLEYTWETDSKNSRAAYADRYLPDFQGFDAKLVAVGGDTDHWELKALISKPASLPEIMDLTQKQVVSGTPHATSAVKVTPRLSKTRSELEWSFTDDQRRGWIGTSVAEPSAKELGKFDVTVRLARADSRLRAK